MIIIGLLRGSRCLHLCSCRAPSVSQDAFGQQPIQALLEQQGLDAQLQQSLLHGVLLLGTATAGSPSSSSRSGGSSGGSGGEQGGSVATPAGRQQPQQMSAAAALERLRLYVQSAGRYGPDTGAGMCLPALPALPALPPLPLPPAM